MRGNMSFIVFLLVLTTILNSCTKIFNTHATLTSQIAFLTVDSAKWIDWNILFTPETTTALKDQQIDYVQNYVKKYLDSCNSANSTYFTPLFSYGFYCPCDSSLYNLSAYPLGGSGQSLSPPPPPPPPHGGSGNGVLYVNSNNQLKLDMPQIIDENYNSLSGNKLILPARNVDKTKTLAIIDTGLDTTLFNSQIGNIIWSSSSGSTMSNFLLNSTATLSYFSDDHPGKHGTGVTAIALENILNDGLAPYPRIMVLKALDYKEQGSTFTVSCALSYAIQNHATLINASLGYYSYKNGEIDSVLLHYLNLCKTQNEGQPIYVIAAAGNSDLPHNLDYCTLPDPANNLLKNDQSGTKLFYPACYNDNLNNVISVTGLSTPNTSCYYQNYSQRYVSLGVLNKSKVNGCCQFMIPIMKRGYEGSSFATPVVSGKVMGCLLMNVPGQNTQSCIDGITIKATPTATAASFATKQGNYTISN
jgi:hypothetical protein